MIKFRLVFLIISLFFAVAAIVIFISVPDEYSIERTWHCTRYNGMVCLGGEYEPESVYNPDHRTMMTLAILSSVVSFILVTFSAYLYLIQKLDRNNISNNRLKYSDNSLYKESTELSRKKRMKEISMIEENLLKIKRLKEEGIITQEEFEKIREEILEKF